MSPEVLVKALITTAIDGSLITIAFICPWVWLYVGLAVNHLLPSFFPWSL